MRTSKSFVPVVLVLAAFGPIMGCSTSSTPTPPPEAFFEVTNDTYDSVDVYVNGVFLSTVSAGTVNTYDLGPAGTYNVQIYKNGDLSYLLNNVDTAFVGGTTAWDVYANAPVVLVQNNYALGSGECVDAYLDGYSVPFALSGGTTTTPPADSTICQGETGFFLVAEGSHHVEVYGSVTSNVYHDDTRTYVDATHVTFTLP